VFDDDDDTTAVVAAVDFVAAAVDFVAAAFANVPIIIIITGGCGFQELLRWNGTHLVSPVHRNRRVLSLIFVIIIITITTICIV
jgi:hypothetical protein